MADVINLDQVLSLSRTFTFKGKDYTFDFSDEMEKAVQDAWIKANAYIRELTDDNASNEIDKKPADDQQAYVHDVFAKQHDIVMGFFNRTIGAEKANQLYTDMNHSTQGMLFVLGLVKRVADKSLQDARDTEYPAFEGNDEEND